MPNIIVMYQSKYGATKRYAQWLSEELACDLIETKKANIDKIKEYDTIILGGGIYGMGISGIAFLKKNYEKLRNKKIIVFAVGASPYNDDSVKLLKEHNFKDDMESIQIVYCRGAWNEERMSFKDKLLCNMLKKVVLKKDSKDYEPWEEALMQAIGSEHDWTEKENLKPILDFIERKNNAY